MANAGPLLIAALKLCAKNGRRLSYSELSIASSILVALLTIVLAQLERWSSKCLLQN